MMLSVIVPALKRDELLERCLASIGEHPRTEVLVVEGVSPVGEARNSALNRARGEWVMFVDADDELAKDWHEALCAAIDAHPAVDVVAFGLSSELPLGECGAGARTREIALDGLLPAELLGRFFQQFAFRREAIGSIRFSRLVRGEDKLFMGEVLLAARRAVVSDAVLYGYRIREGSAMHSPWNRQNLGDEVAWRVRWLDLLAERGRRLDRRARRDLGLYLLEYFHFQLGQVENPALRRELEEYWFDAVRGVDKSRLTPWHRVAMRILGATRSRILVRLLCRMPFLVKRATMCFRRRRK